MLPLLLFSNQISPRSRQDTHWAEEENKIESFSIMIRVQRLYQPKSIYHHQLLHYLANQILAIH